MNLFPANFHPLSNLVLPLVLLLVTMSLTAIVGGMISRRLPRELREMIVGIFAFGGLVLWAWLVFFRHVVPGF